VRAATEPGPPVASGAGRWIVLVRRDRVELYQHLAVRLLDLRFVDLILDRRLEDRRCRQVSMQTDARRGTRRRTPTPREGEHWLPFGYRLVRLDAARDRPAPPARTERPRGRVG
jgi:hypothetical protein